MAEKRRFLQLQNRVERLARKYSQKPISKPYRPRLSELPSPAPAWSKFYRLKDALQHAHRSGADQLRVFAVEPPSDENTAGKREFIVSGYREFWFYYSRMKPEDRHFYEVIEEGSACHLYFDLEFSTEYNSGLDGDHLVNELIEFVCECLETDFKIKCSRKNILELDSTNEKKFSRHLVFHLHTTAFRSNYDAGAFVKKVCGNSGNRFLVKTENGDSTSFIDTGVYTKNRNFRLFQSTKKGKNTALRRSCQCEFDFSHGIPEAACCVHHAPTKTKLPPKERKLAGTNVDELVFYASLVTNVKFQDNLTILTIEDRGHKVTSPGSIKVLCSDDEFCGLKSPFPALHHFIASLVKNEEICGRISKWAFFPCNRTVIYNIVGNRYCGNISRQHKSNHIYYIADLTSKTCYQKCHDPVCVSRGYRSPPIPFPRDVCESVFGADADVTDDVLLDFMNEFEKDYFEKRDLDENFNEWGNVSDADLISALTTT